MKILVFISILGMLFLLTACGVGPTPPGWSYALEWEAVPSGDFLFGDDDGLEHERPAVKVEVDSFYISIYEVTNWQFSKFVEETGYITDAENYGESMVFTNEWVLKKGANWKHPMGPNSSIDGIMDHPVVHVSYFDALVFCEWAEVRLPTEIEWEYACDLGNQNKRDEMNVWTGPFPDSNTAIDGYEYTAPVALSYSADEFGLSQMKGNVWEWCADVYNFEVHDKWKELELEDRMVYTGLSFDPTKESSDTLRVIKGGSFMCHPDHCAGFLPYARQSAEQRSSYFHIGFRVVKNFE